MGSWILHNPEATGSGLILYPKESDVHLSLGRPPFQAPWLAWAPASSAENTVKRNRLGSSKAGLRLDDGTGEAMLGGELFISRLTSEDQQGERGWFHCNTELEGLSLASGTPQCQMKGATGQSGWLNTLEKLRQEDCEH